MYSVKSHYRTRIKLYVRMYLNIDHVLKIEFPCIFCQMMIFKIFDTKDYNKIASAGVSSSVCRRHSLCEGVNHNLTK